MNMTLNSGLKTIPVWVDLEAQVLAWRWNLQSVCGVGVKTTPFDTNL